MKRRQGRREQVHHFARLFYLLEDHVFDGREPAVTHRKAKAPVWADHLYTAAAHCNNAVHPQHLALLLTKQKEQWPPKAQQRGKQVHRIDTFIDV